jgi:thiol:disulfide interchange protein
VKKLVLQRWVWAVLLLAGPAAAATLKSPITAMEQLPVVLMQPYDEHANADAAVAAAFARAHKSHKRVLIDLGGNWCVDCVVLANFVEQPAVKRFVVAHYEWVAVDVGRFDRNLQIPARFGLTRRLTGVPTLIIATPDGKQLNQNDVFAVSEARSMTPQAVADYLAKYAK